MIYGVTRPEKWVKRPKWGSLRMQSAQFNVPPLADHLVRSLSFRETKSRIVRNISNSPAHLEFRKEISTSLKYDITLNPNPTTMGVFRNVKKSIYGFHNGEAKLSISI
jgi:hypothetical protein